MTDAALFGKQQSRDVPPGIPNLPLGCCRTELSARRHLLDSGRDVLPEYPPSSGRNPLELSCRGGMSVKTSLQDILALVRIALHEELQGLREAQVQQEQRLQDQWTTMDAKLNHLLHNRELINRLMNIAIEGEIADMNGSRPMSYSPMSASPRGSPRSTRSRGPQPPQLNASPRPPSQPSQYMNGAESPRSEEPNVKKSASARKSRQSQAATRSSEAAKKSEEAKKLPGTPLHETTEALVLEHRRKKAFVAVEIEPQGPKWLSKIVMSRYFDSVIAISVVFNSILVGVQVNHEATSSTEFETYFHLECTFIGVFTLELILRLCATGPVFCLLSEPQYFWPSFDVILVLLSWVDLALMLAGGDKGLPGPAASVAKVLKLARMARIMRFLRMTKLLAKVRVMGTIIFGSMSSLIWLFLLLATIMYIFALSLTQGASEWTKYNDRDAEPERYQRIKETFGTVPVAMMTLFESVTGGINWGIPNSLAAEIGPLHSLIFSFFIFFFFFSVLNIVTGVYVDGAIQQANNDRTVKEMQKEKDKKAAVSLLSEALMQIDTDDSGCISRKEWIEAMHTTAVRNIMELLEVDISDAHKLFDLVDLDGDDALNITEFVDGMRKLRGNASSIDVHVVMCRLNHLISQIKHWFKDPTQEKYVYKHVRDSSHGMPQEKTKHWWNRHKSSTHTNQTEATESDQNQDHSN